jgi:hypothetical protein
MFGPKNQIKLRMKFKAGELAITKMVQMAVSDWPSSV